MSGSDQGWSVGHNMQLAVTTVWHAHLWVSHSCCKLTLLHAVNSKQNSTSTHTVQPFIIIAATVASGITLEIWQTFSVGEASGRGKQKHNSCTSRQKAQKGRGTEKRHMYKYGMQVTLKRIKKAGSHTNLVVLMYCLLCRLHQKRGHVRL